MPDSLADTLAALTPADRAEALAALTDEEAAAILYDFDTWALPHQRLPKTLWSVALMLAGRGVGKTWTGSKVTHDRMLTVPRGRLIGPTAGDVRDTMIEGPTGILATAAPWHRPVYEPTKRKLTWPNGAVCLVYSGDEPDRLRGSNSGWDWWDELAAFRYIDDAWDQGMLGLRVGSNPQALVTTTPRPRPLIRALVERSRDESGEVVILRASTFDNPYLPDAFREHIVGRYEGTRLGRQELYGELLEDVEGALWTPTLIQVEDVTEPLLRVVVGLDPSGSIRGDDVGIVTAASYGTARDLRAAVLRDASGHYSPEGWASKALDECLAVKADAIVAEVNFGADMVRALIAAAARDRGIACPRIIEVHASRGKQVRAEPVVGQYEQGRVTHAAHFPYLTDQLLSWVPGESASPGAVDALVWAITHLLVANRHAPGRVTFAQGTVPSIGPRR